MANHKGFTGPTGAGTAQGSFGSQIGGAGALGSPGPSLGVNPSLPGPVPDHLIRQMIRDELAAFWTGKDSQQGAPQMKQESRGVGMPRRRRTPRIFGADSANGDQTAQGLAPQPFQTAHPQPLQSLLPTVQQTLGQQTIPPGTQVPSYAVQGGLTPPIYPAGTATYPYAPHPAPTAGHAIGYTGGPLQPPSQAFAVAHAQLTQSMQYNLEKLKTVIEETQLIAQQMEELLAQAGDENRKDKANQPQDWQKGQQTDGARRRQRQSGNA